MAQTPLFRALNRQDYPDAPEWFVGFIDAYNQTVGGLVSALDKGLTRSENFASRERVDIAFRTPAAGNAVVTFGNELGTMPRHVWPTKLARKDSVAIAAAYSLSWSMTGQGAISCVLLGLVASTDYLLSVLYE